MKTLEVSHLSFAGTPEFPLHGPCMEAFEDENHVFEFGKIYCLEGRRGMHRNVYADYWDKGSGAGALSWVIAGTEQQSSGKILIDGQEISRKARRQIAIPMGRDETFFHRFVITQIRDGLKRNKDVTEEWLINTFGLTRLERPLKWISGEKWRSSMAIGIAHSKSVYCFPWLPWSLVDMYRNLWFTNMLRILTARNALVLLPVEDASIWGDTPDAVVQVGPTNISSRRIFI